MKSILFIIFILAQVPAFSQDKPLELKLTTQLGTDSNAVAATEDAQESSPFFSIKPEALYSNEIAPGLWLFGAAAISFKDFEKEIISNAAKNLTQFYEAGISKTLNQNHEVGASAGYTNTQSRQIDFIGDSFNPDGRKNDSETWAGVLSYAYIDSWGSVVANIGYIDNAAFSLTNDEFDDPGAGNPIEFRESYTQNDYSLKFTFNISKDLNISLTPYYSERNYSDKPARNTEGRTITGNPDLEELHRGIDVKLNYEEEDGVKVVLSSLILREKDLVFGAEDADVIGGSASIEIPVKVDDLPLSLKAGLAYSLKDYSNFVTDPLSPGSNDTREDETTAFNLGLSTKIKFAEISLNYSSTNVDSNYEITGASYKQNIFSLETILTF